MYIVESREIPLIEVEASSTSSKSIAYLVNKASSTSLEVSELPQFGGIEGKPTPLELFLGGIASCETFMFRMIASTLGVREEYSITVRISGKFKIGTGLEKLDLEVTITGLDRELAEKIYLLVKNNCPLYTTIRKLGVDIAEKVIIK